VFLDTIKVSLPTDAQNNCFKRILKFTLKQLLGFNVNFNIFLKQLFCALVCNNTLILYLCLEGAGSMEPSTRLQTRGRILICNASMQDMYELFPKYKMCT
jgi:hypothetical protein